MDNSIGGDEALVNKRIHAAKKKFGNDLCILGHFYQQDSVINFADFQGDSFMLAKKGSEIDAKFIVFCGVYFMAESSVILAKQGQRVFLPDMDAGCPLADFASIEQVESAWTSLEKLGFDKQFIPIAYMNSSAAIKAFCGRNDGIICTSSSAGKAFDWAISQNKKIFFVPDENLGRNTAFSKSISGDEIVTWNGDRPDGGLSSVQINNSKVIVWKGYCHVHTFFTVDQIEIAREKYPNCKIVVHPECSPEVVALADGNGSTAYLKSYVEDAMDGSVILVGTEINMVARLAKENLNKKIYPLARSLCPNMFKISPRDLLNTLEHLGELNEVFVDIEIAKDAKFALERMLKL